MIAIFLDTETTGLDPLKHHVIDIAFKAIDLTTGNLLVSYQAIVRQSEQAWQTRDPSSMLINGFTWEQVCSGKELQQIRQEIIDLLLSLSIARGKAVFICQNPGFDRAFFAHLVDVYTQERLNWPYHWLDLASMYWAIMQQKHQPFPETINLSKNEIAKVYSLPTEIEPHRAMNGVEHLILCYQAVLGMKFNK